jgi:hypothetical protein
MNIKKTASSIVLAGLAMGLGTGCTYRVGDFTAMSTKNIYAKGVDISALPKKENVEGSGDLCFFMIGANLKDPLDRALDAGHGNVMIDAVVYLEDYVFFGKYRIKGTVINVPYSGPTTAAH